MYNLAVILSSTLHFLHHLRSQILVQSRKLMHKHILNFEVMHIVLVIESFSNPKNREPNLEHAGKESFAWYQYHVNIVKGESKEFLW